MEDIVMKTQINHSHKNTTINYLFFGITVSIFTLSIYFSFNQSSPILKSADVSALMNKQTYQPVLEHVTELAPIDLKELLVENVEAPITIESWMTKPLDNSYTATNIEYFNTPVEEPALELQTWMVSLSEWSVIETNSTFTEESIPLENWMFNTNAWPTMQLEQLLSTDYAEEHIAIEPWMLSLDSWNIIDANFVEEDIPLESWMVNINEWEVLNDHTLAKQ